MMNRWYVGLPLCLLLLRPAVFGQTLTEQVIFRSGSEGYHTYRIPAIVESSAGTLLAFCEGRKTSSSDAGDIDLVLKRSTDGGDTWGPLILAQEEGGSASITIGNPAPVVDASTGVIWLPFCRNNDRVFVTSSHDDGLTWTPRTEITATVKQAGWGWYATGPCHGIQLDRGAAAGRLLIPCDHRTSSTWGAHAIYSDDHGASWHLGGIMDQADGLEPNESVAVELTDARVYLNARNHGGQKRRVFGLSADGGGTFNGPTTDNTLVEPVVQASAVRVQALDEGDAGNLILFSNPATTSSRTRMTVRRSTDETATWDAGKLIYEGPSAYSDLVELGDGRIGLLFEKGVSSAYETITFVRFDLAFLDAPDPPEADPARAYWGLNEKAPGEAADLTSSAIRDTHWFDRQLHMTAEQPIQYTAGDPRYGSTPALAFTGSQRLRIGDNQTGNQLDFGTEDSFTLEALVRVPSGSGQTGNLVGKDVGSNRASWWFRVESGRVRFFIDDGSNHPSAYSTTLVNDGAWHHVVGMRDRAAGELRVYVDGTLEDTEPDTTTASLANGNGVTIGMYNAGSRAFTGDIDFVRVSNRALPPEEFVPQDHDGDGLPTTWEIGHSLDPNDDGSVDPDQGAEGDPDQEGVRNLDEFVADTNPRSAASFFRIDQVVVPSSGVVDIRIPSSSARVYGLEYLTDLEASTWVAATGNVAGVDGLLLLTDTPPEAASVRMYRTGVSLP